MHDDQADIQYWLSQLRDRTDAERIAARVELARIFEQRGMFEEATDLVVSNVRAGARDAETFRWLARLYRAQGDENLAMQAAAEAAKYFTLPPPANALVLASRPIHSAPRQEIGEPNDVLDAQVQRILAVGYRVMSRTPTTAQLMRPKDFSALWSILWFLLCGVGVLVYIFYYMSKQDSVVHLSVNSDGTVRAQSTDGSARPRSGRPMAVLVVPIRQLSQPTGLHADEL